MPRVDIFLRHKRLQGWHAAVKAATGLEEALNRSQEGNIIVDVLDDIEGSSGGETSLREAGILQRRVDDAGDAASRGIERAIARLDEHGFDTRVLQCKTDEAIATANVINLSSRRELREKRANAFIAMGEPVTPLLNLKAGIISIFRIADRGNLRRTPDAVLLPQRRGRWLPGGHCDAVTAFTQSWCSRYHFTVSRMPVSKV